MYVGDKTVNESEVLVFRGDKFKKVQWQTINVGEIVKVTRDRCDVVRPLWSLNLNLKAFI